MSDLISRETAQAEINKCHNTCGVTHQGVWNECVDSISRTIDYIPSADILEHARAIKEYCERFPECEGCRFYNGLPFRCAFGMCPQEWHLPEGEAKPNESLIKDCCEAQGHLWADNNIFEDVEENQ